MKDIFKKYYLVFIFISLIPILILWDKSMEMSIKEAYLTFDTTQIKGTIKKLHFHKMGTIINFKKSKIDYYFRDQSVYEKQIPKDKWVYDIAVKGDSIYKAAYSDTLFLYKQNGKNYFFVFDRDELYW